MLTSLRMGISLNCLPQIEAEPMEVEEIERTLRDPASGLQERIVRDIGLYTVGLLSVSPTREGERLDPRGTGTLVSFAGERYIKTAAHVWEKLLWIPAVL